MLGHDPPALRGANRGVPGGGGSGWLSVARLPVPGAAGSRAPLVGSARDHLFLKKMRGGDFKYFACKLGRQGDIGGRCRTNRGIVVNFVLVVHSPPLVLDTALS